MPQDFSGQNLRGRSFKGQDLSGANFSYADIRSGDFTNANLRSANFKGAKAGLQRRWAIVLTVVSWVLSGLSGVFSIFTGVLVGYVFDTTNRETFVAGVVYLITLAVFFILTFRKGLAVGLGAFAFAFAVAVAGAFAFAFAGSVAVAVAVAFAFAGAVAFAFAVAFAGAGSVAVAGAFAVVSTLLYAYIGWRSLAGDEKHALIRPLIIAFAATGGTSFRGADLTDADFTSATLRNTDFRSAILIRTCWHQAKMLDRVRPGITYLRNAQLRQWLIANGQNKNFDRQDLRGVNLQGANLTDASFIGANLSAANLQNANLSRAKLVQTQLDETDLTNATLTGAYIEDWGITSHTKLNGVRCEYVYMRLPTQDDPDPCRKPDNKKEVFEEGDFADFIKPIVRTLDLYHNQGVDPRAIAISFKQLAEDNPDAELEIVAMEKRGQDKFLLRAKTSADADHSELSAEYFDTYNQLKGLPEREIQVRLAEKDIRIRSLESMVVTALQRPSFYSSVEQVGFMSNNPGGISQSNTGQMSGGQQAAIGNQNQQTMTTQAATSTEKHLTQPDVIQMLVQIERLIQSADLPTETKEEATSYLGAAKKATEKAEPKKDVAAVNLKTMAETLQTASKTVESSKSLWENVKPILMQLPGWLGVAKGFFGF